MATMFSKQNFGFFIFICTHKTENNMTNQTNISIPTSRNWWVGLKEYHIEQGMVFNES